VGCCPYYILEAPGGRVADGRAGTFGRNKVPFSAG
jgi:hypothetical protein